MIEILRRFVPQDDGEGFAPQDDGEGFAPQDDGEKASLLSMTE